MVYAIGHICRLPHSIPPWLLGPPWAGGKFPGSGCLPYMSPRCSAPVIAVGDQVGRQWRPVFELTAANPLAPKWASVPSPVATACSLAGENWKMVILTFVFGW